MKKEIIAISDTHRLYDMKSLPSGDILILTGDVLLQGNKVELEDFFEELNEISNRWEDILLVPGNHDRIFEEMYEKEMDLDVFLHSLDITNYPSNLTVSVEGLIEIQGLKIWTWSWVPNLPRWAFSMMDEYLPIYMDKTFQNLPSYVDIVVTHGPPKGILDVVRGYGNAGSSTMEKAFNFAYNIHIFGHIHEYGGETAIRDEDVKLVDDAEYRKYYNVAAVDEQYEAIPDRHITITIK